MSKRYPFVVLSKSNRVVTRHTTVELAFNKLRKLCRSFSHDPKVCRIQEDAKTPKKGEKVSTFWLRQNAQRIGYDPVKKETFDMDLNSAGWRL